MLREGERENGRFGMEDRSWGIHGHGCNRAHHCGDKYFVQSSQFERLELLCFHCLHLCYRHSCSCPSSLHLSQVIIISCSLINVAHPHNFHTKIITICSCLCRRGLPPFQLSIFYRIVLSSLTGYGY